MEIAFVLKDGQELLVTLEHVQINALIMESALKTEDAFVRQDLQETIALRKYV